MTRDRALGLFEQSTPLLLCWALAALAWIGLVMPTVDPPAPVPAPGFSMPSPEPVEPRPVPSARAGRSRAPEGRPWLPVAPLDWRALAQCESSGDPRAVSPGGRYRGLFQFDLQTWHGLGMTGDPIDASPTIQLAAARRLFADRGRAPWPVCGKRL